MARQYLLVIAALVAGAAALPPTTPSPLLNTTMEGDDGPMEMPLESWLARFDNYTIMDLSHVNTIPDNETEVETEAETEVEGEEEELSAPILVTVERKKLLRPYLDYQVSVDSLVQEVGYVFLALNPLDNLSTCGLGGFTAPPPPPADSAITTAPPAILEEKSEWEEVSGEFWWASGRLVGGGELTLTYTPPECGCVTLSAHFAVATADNDTVEGEVGGVVAGPEAFPRDLRLLLCVDPSAPPPLIEDEEEVEDVEEEDPTGREGKVADLEDVTPGRRPKGRRAQKAARKAARKEERQAARHQMTREDRKRLKTQIRQEIRQAGMRVTRRRIQQRLREESLQSGAANATTPANHRQARGPKAGKQQARKAKKQARRKQNKKQKRKQKRKYWRKHRNQARKHRRRMGANDTLVEEEGEHNNTQTAEEDRVVDVLLGMIEEEEGTPQEEEEEVVEEEDVVVEEEGAPAGRRGRKKGRKGRHGKPGNARNKKVSGGQGMRFCCKHGIARKKIMLNITQAEGPREEEGSCEHSTQVVSTFAGYKFGVAQETCSDRFQTCCTRFTQQMWEVSQQRKMARLQRRRENRQAIRKRLRRRRRGGARHKARKA